MNFSLPFLVGLLQGGHRTASTRVGLRWFFASIPVELDRLARILILEGVAGVPYGQWSHSSTKIGLAKAHLFFESKSATMSPEWFTEGDSGLMMALRIPVAKAMGSDGLPAVDVGDVLQNSLAGLSGGGKSQENIFYLYGKTKRDSVLIGQLPKAAAIQDLGFMVWRKARNQFIREQRSPSTVPHPDKRIPNPIPDDPEGWAVLATAVIYDLDNPLGKVIRKFLRVLWAKSAPMILWLDRVEKHQNTTFASIAETAGMTPQSFTQNHWLYRWREFFKVLESPSPVMRAIQEGIVGLLKTHNIDPNSMVPIDRVIPPRAKPSQGGQNRNPLRLVEDPFNPHTRSY